MDSDVFTCKTCGQEFEAYDADHAREQHVLFGDPCANPSFGDDTEGQPEGPVLFARLVGPDGFVYEVTLTEDGRTLSVQGRDASVAVDTDALNGE